ncbi:hypothetical protein WJX75_008886 [Coccomyxa subellipsoidea]|uniref:Methyltransferase type 11 domain-containing protein n=1 Tax=Coccomyxa subellipsoidea TaxID=248742 RepID=A0ABR2YIJ5_9CHLO
MPSHRGIWRQVLGSTAQAQWHSADFLSFAKNCREDYDCVLMSFAMHHLRVHDKAELLREYHRLLTNSDGAFLMVDIVRKSGETLSNYQERSQYDVKTNWVGLSPDALASFTDHMLKYDFPETVTTLEEIGVAAGFRSVSIEHVADKGLSQFIAMEA